MHKGWNKLSETFHARFEVVPAVDDALRRAVYRVRHDVYCQEFGFERPNSEKQEVDRFDQHSTALLVRDIVDNQYIACARIVRARPDSQLEPLPFELVTNGHLHEWLKQDPVSRREVGEISRLAVAAQFRRRRTDIGPAPLSEHDFSQGHSAQRFPFIMAGLYLGLLALAQLQGLTRLYLLSEARLANHLGRLGVEITQIGEPVEHRGIRVPSMIRVPTVVAALHGFIRPLYDEIHAAIEARLSFADMDAPSA